MLARVALIALLVRALACDARKEPWRPQFAGRYKVSFNFSVPYVSTLQSSGLTYTYEVLQDYANAKQKIVRDGLETVIVRAEDGVMYSAFPAMDKMMCWKDDIGGGSGPTMARRALLRAPGAAEGVLSVGGFGQAEPWAPAGGGTPQDALLFVLPDLEERRWRYAGRERFGGGGEARADVWEWDLSEGQMKMSYRFFCAADGAPLELHMLGINLYTGGHKDEYVASYYGYQPLDAIPDSEFQPSKDLDCGAGEPDTAAGRQGGASLPALLRKAMPSAHWGDAKYDSFSHRHGRRHGGRGEYEGRRQEFHANARFIAEWNAANDAAGNAELGAPATRPRRHRLAVNHLADWTRQEYLSLLGRRPRRTPAGPAAATFPPPQEGAFLPAEVIWRGTPADSPVKDQAACGSCWAFSAVAALEAALFRTSGEQQLLSEQHLMDCAWGAPAFNKACFGGEQPGALEWALQNGGLAPLASYQYRGVNDFCRNDTPVVPMRGRLVEVLGGEEGLKSALLTQGPMAVSVDAEADEFRFYAGGVYSQPDCATAAQDLNHAVIASGYGVTAEGEPYWLVKNIWSPHWGEGGYIRIARGGNDCGIATQPLFVELEGEERRGG